MVNRITYGDKAAGGFFTADDADEIREAVNALGTAADADIGTAAGNVPVLDGSGKLPSSILPEDLQGIPGPPGADGEDGTSFSVDATGTLAGRTTYDAEAAGFSYLASDTGDLYIRQGGSGWSAAIPFRGPAGTAGADGPPPEIQANSTHIQWRYSGQETWNNVIALADITGAAGADGTKWYEGTEAPADSLGAEGDYYHNTLANTRQIKAAGAWGEAIPFGGSGGTTTRTPTSWRMIVGLNTNYGYRNGLYGAFWDLEVTGDGLYKVQGLFGVGPTAIRYRVMDSDGTSVPLPGITSVQVGLRNLAGATVSLVLNWNATDLRYEGTSAAVYDYIVAHNGATLTVTGLNTQASSTGVVIAGTVPTALTVGQSYANIVTTASGGTAPYTYSLQGTWPAGMTINATTGVISGTPTTAGSYATLSVRATDSSTPASTNDLPTFTITVTAATALAVTGTPTTTGTEGVALTSWTATAVGGQTPYVFSKVGTWPTGVNLNASTGVVSGTPTQTITATGLNVQVTDALGATDVLNSTFTMTIANAFGAYVGYAAVISTVAVPANPDLSDTDYIVGDTLVTIGVNTGSATVPSVTSDVDNPWVLWGSLTEGTNRAVAVYYMVATDLDHTVTWANANGHIPVWAYRGKEPDVLELRTFANSTSITIPEL